MIKIRSITIGTNLKNLISESDFRNFLKESKKTLKKNKISYRTFRLTTNAIDEKSGINHINFKAKLNPIANFCKKNDIRWFCLPFDINYLETDNGKLCKNLIRNFENTFLNFIVNKNINSNKILNISKLIKSISKISSNGFDNFRCGVSINCGPNFPFFPYSYHDNKNNGFSIALEVTKTLNEILKKNKNKDLNKLKSFIIKKISPDLIKIQNSAIKIEKKTGLKFFGMDASLAPFPNENSSVAELIENLGQEEFGKSGTLFLTGFLTGLIKDLIIKNKIKSIGFNGVMFSMLEDHHLAKRNTQKLIPLDSLILYSTVCACGIDMIPISHITNEEEITSRILDIYSISSILNKPLGVRFLPIPDKDTFEKTKFNNDFLFNTRIINSDDKSIDFEKLEIKNFSLKR